LKIVEVHPALRVHLLAVPPTTVIEEANAMVHTKQKLELPKALQKEQKGQKDWRSDLS
jgi:hypothetical protein